MGVQERSGSTGRMRMGGGMNTASLQNPVQLNVEIAFNDIVAWALDDENVMLEIVFALHSDVPLINQPSLLKAILTGDPCDLQEARRVLEEAIQYAAINRIKRRNAKEDIQ